MRRAHQLRILSVAVVAAAGIVSAVAPASAGAGSATDGLMVRSSGMTVKVDARGGIASVAFQDGRVWQLGGRSLLTDGTDPDTTDECQPEGVATAAVGGGAQWQTVCTDSAGRRSTVTETLTPAAGSVAWTVQVASASGTYSKGVWTDLTGWSDNESRQFWTTWGQSPYTLGQNPTWSDPLRPAPFSNWAIPYGGHAEAASASNGFAVPIFMIAEPGTDHSLSLVQSPEDVLLDASVSTDVDGDVRFGRFDNRLSAGRPVTFHMNLVPSAADFRGGLGWMVDRYPTYFKPVEAALDNQLSGLDSYSYQPGPFTTQQRADLNAMGYRTNWDATFSWPYMGEFQPPVDSPTDTWSPFGQYEHQGAPTTMSVDQLGQTVRNYTDAGFHDLAYFNTTEFGTGIQSPRPPQTRQCSDPQLWQSPNDYLYCDFADAVLPGTNGKPISSWEGAVVMDPGTASYQQHLLQQAQSLLSQVPYDGIDIDRLDWVEQFNSNADDGVSWYNGAPARSLVTSWKQLLAKLAPLVHGMGKAVWVSPTDTKRIDWMRGIDGFLSEFNDGGTSTNLDAFLGLDRPVEGWNYSLGDDPDQFLQRFLYTGVYPMSDSPANDHGLGASPVDEQYYKDYAPMFEALQGKQWDLVPHAVQVAGGNAMANIFTVTNGVAVPVVNGAGQTSATLTVRGLAQAVPGLDLDHAEYLSPGSGQWHPLTTTRGAGGVVSTDVPLTRGAALVRFVTHDAERLLPPSIGVTSSAQWVPQAGSVTVTQTARNDATTPITDVSADLQVPDGWLAQPLDRPVATLLPGQSADFRWRVSAPTTSEGVQTLTATLAYRQGGSVKSADTQLRLAAGTPPAVTDRHIDGSTQGSWSGTYGSEGYLIANDGQDQPSGVQIGTPSGQAYSWAADTSDTRALEKVDSTSRIASCWFGTDFSFSIDATDGQTHQVAVYLLDWDHSSHIGPRDETLTVTDAFGNVLDQVDPGYFGDGVYVVWTVQGQVTVNVHMIFGGANVGGNAVVSGIFVGAAG